MQLSKLGSSLLADNTGKHTRWFFFLTIVFCFPMLRTGFASRSDDADPCSAFAKLAIRLNNNGYKVGRDLDRYEFTFGEDFKKGLYNLSDNQTWIDMGAGQGRALAEYASSPLVKSKPRLVGVAYKLAVVDPLDTSFPRIDEGRINFFTGRYLEDIPNHELGKAKIIGLRAQNRSLTT